MEILRFLLIIECHLHACIQNLLQYHVVFADFRCTHCKRLSPTWEELALTYNEDDQSQVVIAKVDCTVDTELCSIQDVTGYPT